MIELEQLSLKQLKQVKLSLETKLLKVNQRIEGFVLSECNICGHLEMAYSDIPEGWGWSLTVDGYLLCATCVSKTGIEITRGLD